MKIFTTLNLEIFKMVPVSDDYKCIGHIVRANGEQPVAKEYCCVATKYVTPARAQWTWNTHAFSSRWPNYKATVWSVVRDDLFEPSAFGIFSGSFIVKEGTEDPTALPDPDLFWLLKGDEHNVKESFLVGRVESKPLELIEAEQDEIWNGTFPGDGCSSELERRFKYYYYTMGSNPCHIYIYRVPRVDGYYNLGDSAENARIGVRGPTGYLVKAAREAETNEHIRLPLYFDLVWREPYNALRQGVGFWMPVCPAGFVALGGVMTERREYPESGSCYCLAAEHVERGTGALRKYKHIRGDHKWDNVPGDERHNSFSQSLQLIVAEATSSQRSLGTFNAVTFDEQNRHDNDRTYPYVLKKSSHNLLPKKRLKTYHISDVAYDWSRLERPTATPKDLPTLMIDNYSRSQQIITRTLEERTEVTNSVSFTSENAINVDFQAEVGDVNLGLAFSRMWTEESEESTTESQTSTISVLCNVLAEHRMYAYVTADTYRTKVPWKGKITKVYWDGSQKVEDIEGMYDAIRIRDINVNYGRMTPLSESAYEDSGASASGSESINKEAAFGTADDYSRNLADIYYRISDQQEVVWSYKGKSIEDGTNEVAPLAFYKATNYEANFYALSDIALADRMKNNVDYLADAWPCEFRAQTSLL